MDRDDDGFVAGLHPYTWLGIGILLLITLYLMSAADDTAQPVANKINSPSTSMSKGIGRPGDDARAMINQTRRKGRPYDLGVLFVKANDFAAVKKQADAHILYFFTAKEGYTASATVLGAMFDPNQYSETSSLMDSPDPEQAAKWYQQAMTDGDSQAKQRLAALKKWAQVNANEGNSQAERVLLVLR
ncbi:MAG: hypothetical protein JKY93_07205 [Gammaproteobacteria bacterium]|nr:hypothetical protein [Gammaproteobacteria bacterium]